MKRRVLIVTSSYAPATMADVHRARHLAWELPRIGWDVDVLFPAAEFQRPEYLETGSAPLFNPDIPGHPVAVDDFWFFRPMRVRTIGWRALRPLDRAGNELLADGRFGLVYISTANPNLFCLGPGWSRRFRVPCVLDYHDPWVRDRVVYGTTGHPIKRWVGAKLSPRMERFAVEGAAGIIAVSPVYIAELRRRYGAVACLRPGHCEAIPFAASERDFLALGDLPPQPAGRLLDIVYVGAGGSIMARAFTAFCRTLAAIRRAEPALTASLRVRLYGTYTYWKEGDPKPLQEIAARSGLSDIVEERPARIPYLEAMQLVQRSAGLLILGVDDEAYVPSKLFTYALSGKPLLASLRPESPACGFFAQLPGLGHLLKLGADDASPSEAAMSAMRKFLVEVTERRRIARREMIAEFLAPAMAGRHAALFERICDDQQADRGTDDEPLDRFR